MPKSRVSIGNGKSVTNLSQNLKIEFFRKAVRATLVLFPLFGLHFLVTIYRPPQTTGICALTEIYSYANYILDGIQGFMVSLIFCYFNAEVSILLKRTYKKLGMEYFFGGLRKNRSSSRRKQSSLGKSVVTTHVFSSSVPESSVSNCLILMTEQGDQLNSNPLSDNNENKKSLIVASESQEVESTSM
jgi:hypothetical protein